MSVHSTTLLVVLLAVVLVEPPTPALTVLWLAVVPTALLALVVLTAAPATVVPVVLGPVVVAPLLCVLLAAGPPVTGPLLCSSTASVEVFLTEEVHAQTPRPTVTQDKAEVTKRIQILQVDSATLVLNPGDITAASDRPPTLGLKVAVDAVA